MGAIAGLATVALAAAALVVHTIRKKRRQWRRNAPTDFQAILESLHVEGLLKHSGGGRHKILPTLSDTDDELLGAGDDGEGGDDVPLLSLPPSRDEQPSHAHAPVTRHDAQPRASLVQPREIAAGSLRLVKKIGGGVFGDVWDGLLDERARLGVPACRVAVKIPKPDAAGSGVSNRADLLQEAALLAQFNHTNIVALVGVVTRSQECKVVLQFCDKGSLKALLDAGDLNNGAGVAQETILRIAADVAAGMSYLESLRFVHRDLASRNVLVTVEDQCCVADFGMSRALREDSDYYKMRTGGMLPLRWSAPETVVSPRYSSASDVWSFFVMMWEVWSDGKRPFESLPSNELVFETSSAVANHRKPAETLFSKPAGVDEVLWAGLVRKCLRVEPSERSTFADLVAWLSTLQKPPDKRATCNETMQETDLDGNAAAGSDYYLRILHNQAGGSSLLEELQRVGMLTVTKQPSAGGSSESACFTLPVVDGSDEYTSPTYKRLHAAATRTRNDERDIVGGLDYVELSTKLKEATEELHKHSTRYYSLFEAWRPCRWPLQLRRVHLNVIAGFAEGPVRQPNPWRGVDVNPHSKRHLSRILAVFSSTDDDSPVNVTAAACTRAIATLEAQVQAGMKVMVGPPKKEARVMQKARACDYDSIRDYARLSLIVADAANVPALVQSLSASPSLNLLRA